ncbi:MAG: PKD domain-containing protein [Flavobacterium sp. JAD_PAG50586_2]|nr:MAG: PKD domain-containing protein [Flavobacterium sp. JAD_PAG50586_2]
MKQLYIAFLFLVVQLGFAKEVLAPTATISGPSNVCLNATGQVITFTGIGGTAPYTFTYSVTGSPGNQTIQTVSGSSVTLPIVASPVGSLTYTLVSVHDAATPAEQTVTGQSVIVTVNSPPTVNFTFTNDNTCFPVQFNAIVGSGTYTYLWNFNDSTPNATTPNPQHLFESSGVGTQTFSVELTITNTLTNCTNSIIRTVTVLRRPSSALNTTTTDGATFYDTAQNIFLNCSATASSPNFDFVAVNASTTVATNTSYTIDWDDSSPDTTTTNFTSLQHTYTTLGFFNISVTTYNSVTGCSSVKIYRFFNGNSPAGNLGSLGNADDCAPYSLTWPVQNTSANPPGTTYEFSVNDSSTPQTFNQNTLPATITHNFTQSSCGLPGNKFTVTFKITNPCNENITTTQVQVAQKPVASFSINPGLNVCTNNVVTFTNTSVGNYVSGSSCLTNFTKTWTITPSTGWNLTAGNLNGTDIINVIFNTPGNYTISLNIRKPGSQIARCTDDTVTRTICVEPPLSPSFTINTTAGCIPLTITTNNTTVPLNPCTPPIYTWSVTHSPTNCGVSIPQIPVQTTNNASFNFTEAGTYVITLTAANSCTPPQTTTQTVTVKRPPIVTAISGIAANYCGSATINPVAALTACTTGTLNYIWSFPGGNPSTSSAPAPGPITYPVGGPYTVSLTVSNECGPSNTTTQTFTVNTAPVITNSSLSQTICSGSATTLVSMTANPAATTFTWSASATAGVTGFLTSGTNTIPVQTISTTNSSPGTVTYVITPTVGACSGTPVNYVVTVNPAPAISTQPSSSTVCQGGTPTPLTVALNSSSVTPTYQWYSNTTNSTTGGTLISGATAATFNPPSSVTGTFYYYCLITLSSGGCSGLTSNVATVTITPAPTVTTQPNPTQELCVGVTIPAPLTVAYTGGTGIVSYQWYYNTSASTSGGTSISGATNATYTPPVFNAAGNYYYYVIISLAGNNCGTSTSNVAEVVVFTDPSVTSQPLSTQTLCQSATPTALQVTATGGSGAFTYQWYSNTANNTTSGTPISGATTSSYNPPTTTVGTIYYYCVISQPTLGCSVTSTVASVIINASPNITLQPLSNSLCSGGTSTALSFTYSNGVGTPTFQWYSNTLNDTVNGTAIIGATNQTYTPPATTVGVLYYYCLITFPNLTGSCATIATATAAITVTQAPVVNQQPLPTQNLCVGGTIPNALTVTYSNGTGTASYQWYSNNTNSTTGGTPVGTNAPNYTPPVFSTAGTYYYYVVISFSGNGCGAITSNTAQIDVLSDPILTTQPLATQTICQNAAAASLTVVASGGIGSSFDYQWYNSPTNTSSGGTPISGATNATFTPPTTAAGTFYYYCQVTQPSGIGCGVTSAVATVIINLAPLVSTQPIGSSICVGNSSTVLSLAYSNGVGIPTYQWYSNSNNSNTGGTAISGAVGATYSPPSSTAGTIYYYCVITFPSLSGGCEVITTNTAEIIVNDNPVISPQSTTICSTNTFTISPIATGGDIVPLGTTYIWTNPVINPPGAVTGAGTETTPQANISQTLINTTTSPATVTYTVTPTSGTCIGNSFTVTVTVNPAINPNVVLTNNACFGVNIASITTNVTGGIPFSSGAPYHYTWSGPNSFSSTASGISNLAPGNYNLTIDDAGNCPFTSSYTITEPTDIVIMVDSENDITCYATNNGSINITVTGGTGNYAYTWTQSGNPNTFASTEDIANLIPGNYTISVTDANNCGPRTMSFTITEPPLLVVSLVSQVNVLCYGASTGAITVNAIGGTPGGGYNFSWSGPNGFTSSNQNLIGIAAGTYDLTITDANSCTKTLSVIITQSTEILIAYTTTPITCYGANNASLTVTLSGGNPPYTFVWNNLSTSLSQTNLSAGTYIITVTDNVGCIQTQTIIIPDAPVFTVNPIVSNVTCRGANNGSINLNLTGGIAPVALTWSDGSTAGLIRNNLAPGTYTATISDGTPCYIVRTFTIVEPQSLVVSANLTNAFDCTITNSGAIDLIVAGGTPPYTYNWSTGAVIEDLANLTSGNYAITVTDANNCTANAQYAIIRQDPITISVATQTNFDCAAHTVDQSFVATVSGGIPPYQLQWSSGTISGANNEIMHTNINGTVLLTATDSNNCTGTYTLTVDTPVLGYPSFDTTSYGFVTYGLYAIGDPIQFQSTITGDYVSVSWDFGDGTFSTDLNPVHTYLIPKDYVVTQTVTYPFGCVYVQTISLLVEKGYVLVVPTAYTPNNDGLNDTFRPVTKGLKNVVLDIYDTWGSLIYSETGEVLVGWDGKIKGFNAENGNYYSKVRAETFYGTVVNSNQTFVLIK